MSRKVFISVLGTGFYGKCVYAKEGFKSSDTRFIQAATLEMLTSDGSWKSDTDAAYILLTGSARSANWQVDGNVRYNVRTKTEEEYVGLKDELDSLQLPFEIEPVDIPDGKNEKEIWDIFDVIYNKLKDGDELYFDVTHGFRYLPMLVLVLCNYAKFLRGIKVQAITYGNYEVADKTKSPAVAPFVDITPLSVLQDWTNAASDYLRHGDARALKESSMLGLKPILVQTKGSDEEATNLRKLVDKLNDFSENLSFCRGMSVYQGTNAQDVETYVGSVTGDYLKPMQPLLAKIRQTIDGYSANSFSNMLQSAQLCLHYENYQASVTLLQEGVVTFFCLRHGISVDDDKKRECVNRAITKKQLALKDDLWKYTPKGYEELVDKIFHDELLTREFIEDYSNLTDVRNDMNHAGMRSSKKPMSVKPMRKNIEKCVKAFSEFCNADCTLQKPLAVPHKKKLFINLSNHPFSNWSEEQQAAARVYGEIDDWDFPSVPPHANEDEIDGMAKKCVGNILKDYNDADVTVHVMGEMSLTFRIVQLLKSHGIRCLCSTTQRMVAEQDGRKVTEFHFEQFREY